MNFQLFFEMLEIMLQLVGFTAIGIARGPVELEGLDDANVVAENQETICYKGGLDDTDEIFINSADQQRADRGCEGTLRICLDQANSISEKCWKFHASKMLEIKNRHLT